MINTQEHINDLLQSISEKLNILHSSRSARRRRVAIKALRKLTEETISVYVYGPGKPYARTVSLAHPTSMGREKEAELTLIQEAFKDHIRRTQSVQPDKWWSDRQLILVFFHGHKWREHLTCSHEKSAEEPEDFYQMLECFHNTRK